MYRYFIIAGCGASGALAVSASDGYVMATHSRTVDSFSYLSLSMLYFFDIVVREDAFFAAQSAQPPAIGI